VGNCWVEESHGGDAQDMEGRSSRRIARTACSSHVNPNVDLAAHSSKYCQNETIIKVIEMGLHYLHERH